MNSKKEQQEEKTVKRVYVLRELRRPEREGDFTGLSFYLRRIEDNADLNEYAILLDRGTWKKLHTSPSSRFAY